MRTDLKRKIGSLAVSLLMVAGQYAPLFGTLLTPNYAFASPALPLVCPGVIGDYNLVDIAGGDSTTDGKDFIFAGDSNTVGINAKKGDDCILIGDNNSGKIDGGNGNDVIVVGNNNGGEILGGENNDKIVVGNNNSAPVNGGKGDDTITIGDSNSGKISGHDNQDKITVGDNNTGEISGDKHDDVIIVGNNNSGKVSGGDNEDDITIGDNNSGDIYGNKHDDTITVGCGNTGIVDGGEGNDTVTVGGDCVVADTTAPAVPDLVSPFDGAVIKPSAAVLDWTDVSDPSGPVIYWYQSFWSGGGHYGPVSTGTNSFINATGSADRVYQWQVQACDSAPVPNCSAWSPLWEVTIDGTVPPTPTIVFPGAEQYFTSQPILNDWTDVVDNLSGLDYYRIEYAYDDGHTFSGFPYRTATISERNHTPGIGEQGGVRFRVQAFDKAGNEGAWSEWRHYYYDASDPWTVFTSPTNGQIFAGPIHISGISEDNPKFGGIVDWVDLFYSVSGENDWQPLVTNSNPAGYEPFSWGTNWTPLVDGTYDLKAVATDRAGNVEGTAYVYGIIYDNTDPVVEITSPTETFLNGTVAIRGSVNDTNPWRYWLVIQNSSNSTVAGPGTVYDSTSFTDKFFFNWNTTAVPDGTYTIKLEARDLAGNKSGNPGVSYDWMVVTVDNTAPVVTWNSPLNGDEISGDSVLLDAGVVELNPDGGISYFYKVLGANDSTLLPISSPWDLALISLDYYTLVARASDLAGNLGEARIDIAVKAVVSGETAVGVSTTSFAVAWTTDKPTTSRVVYDTVSHPVLGAAPNYGYAFSTDTFDIDPKVTSHSVFLTGLTPGKTYYFRTISSGSPTTIGEERSVKTGDVLGEETEREEGEVLPATGVQVERLAFAALAFAVGSLLRRKSRFLKSR